MAINPLLNGSQVFSNISATTAAFALRGGLYGITAHAASWGTVTLQRLSPDATTYINVITTLAADGYATVQLPPGSYKVTVLTATTGLYIDIIAIATDI